MMGFTRVKMQTDARAPRAKKSAAISLENSDKIVVMCP